MYVVEGALLIRRDPGSCLGQFGVSSLEQAEKYTQSTSHSVDVAKHRKPDLLNVLADEVPDGAELLAGEARLWKERRIPTPNVYFLGLGKLLAEVEYDAEHLAWYSKFRRVEGSRREIGLMTPLLHISSTRIDTTGYW